MKVGIIGAGAVGAACAKAMLLRGSCREIVLLDKLKRRAKGVAADLSHGAVLCPPARIWAGAYDDLADADIVVITAGKNEKAGNAIDRNDPKGRLRLLSANADIYRQILPSLVSVAPHATILVVTDPPDALADIARDFTKTNPVLSSGTYLDTLRFRLQLAQRLKCHPESVEAFVLGEHGTSQVYAWSSARVGGAPILQYVREKGGNEARFRSQVERAVKYANIDIIEGTGASQHGIGIVTARLVEAMLGDEGLVAPIGSFNSKRRATISLPSIIRKGGVSEVFMPSLSVEELDGLAKSAKAISDAVKQERERQGRMNKAKPRR